MAVPKKKKYTRSGVLEHIKVISRDPGTTVGGVGPFHPNSGRAVQPGDRGKPSASVPYVRPTPGKESLNARATALAAGAAKTKAKAKTSLAPGVEFDPITGGLRPVPRPAPQVTKGLGGKAPVKAAKGAGGRPAVAVTRIGSTVGQTVRKVGQAVNKGKAPVRKPTKGYSRGA
jgi:hypothetical protein